MTWIYINTTYRLLRKEFDRDGALVELRKGLALGSIRARILNKADLLTTDNIPRSFEVPPSFWDNSHFSYQKEVSGQWNIKPDYATIRRLRRRWEENINASKLLILTRLTNLRHLHIHL